MSNIEVKWYEEKGENGVSFIEAMNKVLDQVNNSRPDFKNEKAWKDLKQEYIKLHLGE